MEKFGPLGHFWTSSFFWVIHINSFMPGAVYIRHTRPLGHSGGHLGSYAQK